MNAVEISNENLEEFLPLLGADLTEDMKRVYYRGIGVTDTDAKPVGAFVYELLNSESAEDTKSMIRFTKSKSKEIGNAMQEFYRANSVGAEEITESSYALPEEAEAEAFLEAGFSKEKTESEDITVTLEDIAKLNLSKKKIPDYIGSLEKLSILDYRTAIKEVLFKGHKGIAEDLAYLPKDWFDGKVSSCSVSDQRVDGFFLIRKTPSGTLIPELFFAYGPLYKKNLLHMMAHSAKMALENYSLETKVLISRRSQASRALIGKLLPKFHGAEIFAGKRKEQIQ